MCTIRAWALVLWCLFVAYWQVFYNWLWKFPPTRWLLTIIIIGIAFLILSVASLYCWVKGIDLLPREDPEV